MQKQKSIPQEILQKRVDHLTSFLKTESEALAAHQDIVLKSEAKIENLQTELNKLGSFMETQGWKIKGFITTDIDFITKASPGTSSPAELAGEYKISDDLVETMAAINRQPQPGDSVALNTQPIFLRITDADGFVTDERGKPLPSIR